MSAAAPAAEPIAPAPSPAAVDVSDEAAAQEEISKHASLALAAGARLASLEMAQEIWVDVAGEALAKQREVDAEVAAEWKALGAAPVAAPEGAPEAKAKKTTAKKGDKKASSRHGGGKGNSAKVRTAPSKASGGSPPLATPKGGAKGKAAKK